MTTVGHDPRCNPKVGLVLAGGGARGAYEAGALATLLPYLEQIGDRPGIVLGTSIGALNGAFLASTAHLSAREATDSLLEAWRGVAFNDIIGPLVSVRELSRVLLYFGGLLGIPGSRVPSLLDTTPLPGALQRIVDFDQLHRNVDEGLLSALAVVATSYATAESVVFHEGPAGVSVPLDVKRAIRYVPSRAGWQHVEASASIPMAFTATRIDRPAEATGWYGDGGTRLNTPIKPALKLGAERVVVIALNSSTQPPRPQTAAERPDIFDGAAQVVQALLVDQVAQDVITLSHINRALADLDDDRRPDRERRVQYILVAPSDRWAVGRLARDVYRKHLCGVEAKIRAPDLTTIGCFLSAGDNAVRGDLYSLLFFAAEFYEALFELGREDAERWLSMTHDDGPWRFGDPPSSGPPRAS